MIPAYYFEGLELIALLEQRDDLLPNPRDVAPPSKSDKVKYARNLSYATRSELGLVVVSLRPPAVARLETAERKLGEVRAHAAELEAQLAAKREELATTADPVLKSVAMRAIHSLEGLLRDSSGYKADAVERVRIAQENLDVINARLATAIEGAKQVLAEPVPV